MGFMDEITNQNQPEDNVTPNSSEMAPEESQDAQPSERTAEQIEKLKQHNQELKNERDQYKNVYDALRPKEVAQEAIAAPTSDQFSHLNQQQVNDAYAGLIDSEGYVDVNKLTGILTNLNDRAQRAENEAQQARRESRKSVRDFEESKLIQQTHRKFPELDPQSEKFNKDYFDYVTNELIGQMRRGEDEDLLAAADKWHKKIYGTPETKEEQKQREQGDNARVLINTTPQGGATRQQASMADEADLVRRTREGDPDALKERLKRIGL